MGGSERAKRDKNDGVVQIVWEFPRNQSLFSLEITNFQKIRLKVMVASSLEEITCWDLRRTMSKCECQVTGNPLVSSNLSLHKDGSQTTESKEYKWCCITRYILLG